MERILLVDDEEVIRFAYKKVLSGPLVAVDTASSFNKALHLLQNKSYDAVIADLRLMPGSMIKEGLEVIRQAKRMQSFCKVVVVTGCGEDGTQEEVIQLGADIYLEKPASPQKVKTALQSLGMTLD
jgi:DNA-binding response OmpR family regulator